MVAPQLNPLRQSVRAIGYDGERAVLFYCFDRHFIIE